MQTNCLTKIAFSYLTVLSAAASPAFAVDVSLDAGAVFKDCADCPSFRGRDKIDLVSQIFGARIARDLE